MEFVDPAPPCSPSVNEQSDALQKGLGRAWQWAIAGKLDDAPLLEACLHDPRHDMEVEQPRGNWLWQLILAVGAAERFRGPILDAVTRFTDERHAYQLCELAYFYAAAGDEDFRKWLYEIVEQKPFPDSPVLGDCEILRLDGEQGFLFVAKVRGARLKDRAWEWDDDSFLYDAVEQLGEAQVEKLLLTSTDKSVREFGECWVREKKKTAGRTPQPSHIVRMQAIGVDEIVAEAKSERPTTGSFRGWGMHASDDDLNKVLMHVWSAENPKVIVGYLRVFSNRALPTFDPRLIDLCTHTHEEVRRWAFNALKMNAHPLVREFAMASIQQGLRDRHLVGLLIRNYAPRDEMLLLEALELPTDVNELHWLLMDVIEVLEHNTEADPYELALVIYAHTPCENCRFQAARMLHSRQIAPVWMPAECRYDSSEDTRGLFPDVPLPE